jgi:hypothetical protein
MTSPFGLKQRRGYIVTTFIECDLKPLHTTTHPALVEQPRDVNRPYAVDVTPPHALFALP